MKALLAALAVVAVSIPCGWGLVWAFLMFAPESWLDTFIDSPL